MNTFITIIVLIVMLGILILTHELGHLLIAKGFNVYCSEYSIGFGPKIFSWRKKNGETQYSLRAIPLGGYVSMFGEEADLEEGEKIPLNRSLAGIKTWKRILVFFGGIAINLFTAILFCFIYAFCFPSYYTSQAVYNGFDVNGNPLNETSIASPSVSYGLWANGTLGNENITKEDNRIFSPLIVVDDNLNQRGYLIDSNALIDGESYVAVYESNSYNDVAFLPSIRFYTPKEAYFPTPLERSLGIVNQPNYNLAPYTFKGEEKVTFSVQYLTGLENTENRPLVTPEKEAFNLIAKAEGVALQVENSPININIVSETYWPSAMTRFNNACNYFMYFFEMIGLGLASLFTFNFSNLGSVVAMGGVLSQSSAMIGWGRTFFLYGGFISLNLAIFNLLPIPGLDGWQILVTTVERVFKKQIPDKVKSIMSLVGIGLLLLLGIGIIFRDVINLFI